ncbi:armadillo repeat-containing protein 2 isoform X2 [Coccinella septempunctata]|uniref:armadillo repeat-containing protein 2 isoform X2 n=1 Tax=Coccinella septempunctata TaxID=41139 RepID=UPI001D05D197|nr:armadillo repeat-containing protein 2 isoform X2 [Coccinella septempunctata]
MDTKNQNFHISGSGKFSTSIFEPSHRKTSAEIINEARHAIREIQPHPDTTMINPAVHPLQTQRPFTPREKERHLFGNKSKTVNRPPSSFSLRYLQNETDLPTNNLPETNMILSPSMLATAARSSEGEAFSLRHRSNSVSEINDDKIFNIGVKDLPMRKVRLPSLERPFPKRKLFKKNSLDNLPEEAEEVKAPQFRNAYSSPEEKTEYNQSKFDSPFGRPSKRQDLAKCLLLGPQNLEKIFDNRQIIENSTTLFVEKVLDAKDKTVDDILQCLNMEAGRGANEETVVRLLSEMYDCMERQKMLDVKVTSKMKIQILKCLYKYVESTNQVLLLSLARIILALKVTGNNLSGVCKLLFKVAKNDSNDHLFLEKNILELLLDALGRSSPLDDSEACVYGYGAVKFLSMNNQLQQKMISLGTLDLMALHMKIINVAKIDKITMTEQTRHVLFQLTGALRNLASDDAIYERFNVSRATSELCVTMELFFEDPDVISNISRILSIISTSESCCNKIIEKKDIYEIFIKLFEKYSGNEEIIVRLTYTMGNIVAKIDSTREKFFHENKSIDSLLKLWKIYLERTLKLCSLKMDDGSESDDGRCSEDVMIKVLRIVANIVINPDIGREVNEKYGIKLIDEFLKVLISNPFKKNQELVLAILGTLNNLSFYYITETEQDVFHVRQVDIIEGISEYTKSTNDEYVVEAMRILGNLSRSKITISYTVKNNIFQTLIELLDHSENRILKTTLGVFVNLMADNKSRTLFKKRGGVKKCISILEKYGQSDWLMGTLVCQALWNYAIDCMDLYELFSEDEIQKLLVLLADYLDDEKLFGIKDDIEDSDIYSSQEYMIWDEFANVATNLLEKIEYFLDTFDQIDLESKVEVKKIDNSTNLSFAAW